MSTLSGSQTVTGTREQGGLFIDVDSSATGGTTTLEHRAYGIYVDVDVTGDADAVHGILTNATVTPTVGTVSAVYGANFTAEDNGGAGQVATITGVSALAQSDNADSDVNTMFGGWFQSNLTGDSGFVNSITGVRAEVQVASGAGDVTNTTRAVHAIIDNNTIQQTNTSYLFHGSYEGILPTTAYGIYISSVVSNYFGGSITAAGDITAFSDERLKSDITTIDDALDKVTSMRGVTFTKNGKAGSGVIAQELEKIAPELVMDGEEYKSVAYGNLVGYLIEAVKELSAKVEELENASSK